MNVIIRERSVSLRIQEVDVFDTATLRNAEVSRVSSVRVGTKSS